MFGRARRQLGTMLPKKAMKATKSMKVATRALTKTAMADGIATSLSLKKRDVVKVIGALAGLGAKEVKSVGKFVLPGLCMVKTRKKPATKAGAPERKRARCSVPAEG